MFGFEPAMASANCSSEFEVGKGAQRKANKSAETAKPQAEKTTPSKESR